MPGDSAGAKLAKSMTPVDYFTLGFGAIVGVGWVALMGDWIKLGGGVIPTALGFILAALLMLPMAFCYSELAPAIPAAGGSIAYSYRAYGTGAAFWVGWFTVLAYLSVCPWEAIAIGHVLSGLYPGFKVIPLYFARGYEIYLPVMVIGVVTTLVIAWANYRGVRQMAALQKYLTYLLMVAGVLVIIFGFIFGKPGNIMPVFAAAKEGAGFWAGVFSVFVMAPFFLAGFDTIAQGAEEAGKINYSSLGKTVILSMVFASLFYVLVIFVAGYVYPWQELVKMDFATSTVFKAALKSPFLAFVAIVGALAGLLTTFNGLFYATSRVLFAMSRARLLPAALSRVHPKYNTPYVAVIVTGIISLLGPFIGRKWLIPLADIGAIGFVAMYLGGTMAAYKLRSSEPDLLRPYRMPGGRIMAVVAIIASIVILFFAVVPGLPSSLAWPTDYVVLLGWIVLGLIIYVAGAGERQSLSEQERSKVILGN
ncbi:MAG: APC family permease [Bacillota bacterium]